MIHSDRRPRFVFAVFAALLMTGCIGEPVSTPESRTGWTGKQPQPIVVETHMRGVVINRANNELIPGAVVEAVDLATTTSLSDGSYTLQRLRSPFANLVVSKPGYDTLRVLYPLNGGDVEFNLRMTVSVPVSSGIR